jgi:hypothetical protein
VGVFFRGIALALKDRGLVIMFARVPIPPSTAEMFRAVALNVKMVILPFVEGPIFAG